MLFKTSIATAVGAAGLAMAANPDKPEISPSTDYNGLESGLLNNLHPTHSNWDYWGAGYIPQACKDVATSHGLSPNDFTIFNVHYDDCPTAWIFCRHKDSGASEINMIDYFGRAPVHMRQFVRQFIATPGLNDGAAAFTYYSGDVVFEDSVRMSTLMHEMSHSLDWHALDTFSSPFSGTDEWQREYAKDSSTPTGYGRTNWMEDFAEVGPVGVYDKVVPGGFGGLNSNWNAIFHQYATYQGYLGDKILPGGTCDFRFTNSATTTKSSNARLRLGAAPDTAIKGDNVTIIEVDPEMEKLPPVVSFNKYE